METRKIRLTQMEEVKEFVNAASGCDFDVDIFYNRVIIDAKSFLGVASLDLTRVLNVSCQGYNRDFENTLNKFASYV
ncbi:HPr family phosphocarrier protein [[Clostridium] polysaccharolyticum]|jgi:hypothetical protein|uniref:PTS HPr component phosphorylation site n=1 Tax=[Clostridium] polysaccharolyticum TaxID=29364 RepID=A0A1I0DNR9_9FIRM|nr:HPr family phosphocarrier protein [[Clostridium] polysaccharolyticum]SET33352.1 hypothetical protein SAMN04487772_11552 [[Clostridium] polysaccharolyticum]